MARAGWFDSEAVPLGTFDETGEAGGWFDTATLDGSTSNAYTLTATTGAIALSGTATGVRAQRSVAAVTVAFTLAGTSTVLRITLPASTGSLALAGTTTALLAQRKLSASTGAVAVSGQNAGLGKGQRVVASTAALAITGPATGLTSQRKIAASVGAIAQSGTTTGLARGLRLAASTGTLAGAGTATGLRAQRRLTASVGSESLAGTTAGLLAQHGVTASPRSFDLSSSPTAILAGHVLALAAAAALLVGKAAGLAKSGGDHPIVAGQAAIVLVGSSAALRKSDWPFPPSRSTVIQSLLSSRVQGVSLSAFAIQTRLTTNMAQIVLSGTVSQLRLVGYLMSKLSIHHGDSVVFDTQIFSSSGGAYPLTGCTVACAVKASKGAASSLATISQVVGGAGSSTPSGGSIAITDEAKGRIRVTIPASMSSGLTNADTELAYEVTVTTASGAVHTAVDSTIKVLMGV